MARERQTATQCRQGAAGLTLLELLLVMGILMLTLSFGGTLAELLQRERHFRDVLALRRLLNFTRSEAVFRETPMTLCAIGKGQHCQQHWTGMQIAVFEDRDRDFRLDPGEAIRIEQWPQEQGLLVWRAALGRRYLVFNPGGDTAQNGSFLLCRGGKHSPVDVMLSVNRGGRSYIREDKEKSRRRCA